MLENISSILESEYAKLLTRYNDSSSVSSAVKYVLSGEGKKIRPVLCLLSAASLGGKMEDAIDAALAIEMIHTYSLVHDDLPCMDDDDMRRGRPTAHKKFDEATAVLAGDALLTDAFSIISEARNGLSFEDKLRQVAILSRAAGGKGMVLGQSLDMENTGKGSFSKETLDAIHTAKTGALIGASLALGAASAKKDEKTCEDFYMAGLKIGLSFQILDDLLDASSETGKTAGKDLEAGKLTYLAVMTKEKAKEAAEAATTEALELISSYTNNSEFTTFILNLLDRKK